MEFCVNEWVKSVSDGGVLANMIWASLGVVSIPEGGVMTEVDKQRSCENSEKLSKKQVCFEQARDLRVIWMVVVTEPTGVSEEVVSLSEGEVKARAVWIDEWFVRITEGVMVGAVWASERVVRTLDGWVMIRVI